MKKQKLITFIGIGIFLFLNQFTISALQPGHYYYLHALSDLRSARWMIEHRPGNWQTTVDETEAVNRIDAAINEIKRAAIDDGKDINDHVYMDEHPDHLGRLHDAIDFLRRAQQDVNQEDNMFNNGLQGRTLVHINEAIRLTDRAIASTQTYGQPNQGGQNFQPGHPFYLRALSDLRVARWMIDHRPGNWQAAMDETEAVNRIDAAINEIKRAAIDDGKDINDHIYVDEHPDHMGRLHDAADFLRKAQNDVNQDEDNRFADGLQARALMHINEAIRLTDRAITSTQISGQTNQGGQNFQPGHPFYLRALSDLRVARWMIEHRPGDWQATEDEIEAVRRIDAAIFEIKKASIDDGKDINDHVYVDEHTDHMGRLQDAADFLRKAQNDVNQDEDNSFADGLQAKALMHINEAIRLTDKAMHQ